MRRKSSAAVDQLDPRELIERVTAEHSSPSVPSPPDGRTARSAVDTAVPAADLLEEVSASGRHRRAASSTTDASTTDASTTDDAPGPDTGATIAELHDPHPSGPLPVGGGPDSALIEIDRTDPPRRSRVRRFAPLGIGVAAALAGVLVLTLLQPGAEDPDLNAALVDDPSRRSVSDSSLTSFPGVGDGAGGGALGDATEGAADQIGTAVAAQEAAEQRRRDAAASATGSSGESSGGSADGGAGAAGDAVAGAAQVAGEGLQTALAKGWQAIGGDEFTGSGLGESWSAYDGPGHDGNGTRTPDAVSVENGNLVIRGDSEGNTGGIAWGEPRKYGKWEMRAKFPAGDKQYHPVLLLWPSEVSWPEGGEIDFAETNSAAEDVSFFLHYGSSNSQEEAKQNLDITQWHNYAVEWTPDAVIGYIDGKEWFRSTDPETLPPGPMHATIQLDYFPDGGSPQPSEMHVAWMRQYS
ncbi:family 16 glycosylhydrolase [Pseudonocardia nantongensis]|uniref:glycoside hydrolase family 16 protein n=1 Tax=Pseudonocardia nantongensis TaxID=1181885 RepID=UPI00397894C6